MKPISHYLRLDIERRIVERFGDGVRDPDKYLFEQIVRVPDDWRNERLPFEELARHRGDFQELLILFDHQPNNRAFVREVCQSLGLYPVCLAYRATWRDVAAVASFDHCDFYITASDGLLLGVGTHEDPIVDGKRLLWCPLPGAAAPGGMPPSGGSHATTPFRIIVPPQKLVYNGPGNAIHGEIWVEAGEFTYPSRGWNDIVSGGLRIWLERALESRAGELTGMTFLDGPHQFDPEPRDETRCRLTFSHQGGGGRLARRCAQADGLVHRQPPGDSERTAGGVRRGHSGGLGKKLVLARCSADD